MNLRETAEDALGLVQALAQGKELEFRGRGVRTATWTAYAPAEGEILLDLMLFEYRIKVNALEEWCHDLLEAANAHAKHKAQSVIEDFNGNPNASARQKVESDDAWSRIKVLMTRVKEIE